MVFSLITSIFLIIFILKLAKAAEKLVLTDLTGVYTSSQISWNANNVYLCGATDFTEFANTTALGWFGLYNNSTQNNFTNLPPHWSISVRFELILYQSLDPNDYIYVNINQQTDSYQKDAYGLGYYFCVLKNNYYDEICTSCRQNLIFLNSQCYSECPSEYYTYEEQQTKECKLCNYKCKLGCSGPFVEDCNSIKFQYQIIFYILSGKFLLWSVSFIIGYIMDKKQSRVQVEIQECKNSVENGKLDNFQESSQIEDDSHKQEQAKKEEKSSNKFKTETGSQQNQQDQINLDCQALQFQMQVDLDKMKRVGNRRPRQKFYKNPFYDKSMQTFEFQIPSIALNTNNCINLLDNKDQVKSITTVPNLSQLKTSISGIKQLKIKRPYIYKYKSNEKFKFIILGNEWVSLFYFYDQNLKRQTRVTLIFLKYLAFFLSTELIYQLYLIQSHVIAEQLVLTDLNGVYTSSQISWKANDVYLCGATDFTEFANTTTLGWLGLRNNSTQNNFTNLPPHWSISVRFELILYQSLDPDDYVYVNINGQTDAYQKDAFWLGYYFCKLKNSYYDEIVLFHKNLTSHTDSFINILCTSCQQNLIFLNSQCYSECPSEYYTYEEQQTKECKLCNYKCKLGCSGPFVEDCNSIKFQYQIIFYILSGKFLLWGVSFIIGYIMDKKQSRVQVEIQECKNSVENGKLDNFQESHQIEDDSHRQEQTRKEEKSSTKFKTEIGQQENQQDQINLDCQALQFQMQVDLDKMKRVGNRRPRQKFYKNHFYDKSMQTFEFQIPSIALNMNNCTHLLENKEQGKSITTVPNLSQLKTSISGIQEEKQRQIYWTLLNKVITNVLDIYLQAPIDAMCNPKLKYKQHTQIKNSPTLSVSELTLFQQYKDQKLTENALNLLLKLNS
ncbi:hypothetical protein ABPG74_005115 [Tetrahymena malaccensis]